MPLIRRWRITFLGSESRMSSFLKKLFAGVKSVARSVTRSVTRSVLGKKRASASRKKKNVPANIPANAPAPAPAPAPSPAPAPAPGPVAPQAAGKKMRAKNLRGMKFYKPSRRAVKKGRKLSRRRN